MYPVLTRLTATLLCCVSALQVPEASGGAAGGDHEQHGQVTVWAGGSGHVGGHRAGGLYRTVAYSTIPYPWILDLILLASPGRQDKRGSHLQLLLGQ